MTDDPLFDFAVPEDLLREAVSQIKDSDVVADLEVMPGTGEGKPPPLIGILKSSGYAPLVLLTAAALVPGTFGNGINLIGKNLETSFHMSNASLGRGGLHRPGVAAPVGCAAGRCGPTGAAARWWPASRCWSSPASAPSWPSRPTCGGSPSSTWLPRSGTGVNNTVHNSYLSDAYPTESRGRIFSWHNLSDPHVADDRHPDLRLRRDRSRTTGVTGCSSRWPGSRSGLALFTLNEPEKGAEREQPHPQGVGHGPARPAGEGAPGAPRFGGDPAAADPLALLRAGGRGHPRLRRDGRRRSSATSSSSTSSTSTRRRGARSTPSSAWPPSSGFPWPTCSATATSAGRPQRPLVIAGICITAYGGLLRPVALRAPALAVRDPAVPGQRGGLAAGHLHLPDAGRDRPARNAHHLLRHVRRLLARLRRLRRLGAARRRLRRHRWPARHRRRPHHHLPGLRHRRVPAHHRLAQRAARHHARHRRRD